jgi:hypothetical protein
MRTFFWTGFFVALFVVVCVAFGTADAETEQNEGGSEQSLNLDLEQRYPVEADNIRRARKAGLSDQRIREWLDTKRQNYHEMGFTDPQINEMFRGERPFPPNISPLLLGYPALLSRMSEELQALLDAPVPYQAPTIKKSLTSEEKLELQHLQASLKKSHSDDDLARDKLKKERDELLRERDELKQKRSRAEQERDNAEMDAAYWFFNRQSRQR